MSSKSFLFCVVVSISRDFDALSYSFFCFFVFFDVKLLDAFALTSLHFREDFKITCYIIFQVWFIPRFSAKIVLEIVVIARSVLVSSITRFSLVDQILLVLITATR